MGDLEYDLLNESLRVLFLVGLPLLGAALLAGVLAGVLQAATSVQDSVVGYALKLVAVVVVLFLLLNLASNRLGALTLMAFS